MNIMPTELPTKYIREHREKAGLTQEQVADKLGLHLTNYNKLEKGKTAIKLDRLMALAEILKCQPADLLAPPSNMIRVRAQGYLQAGIWTQAFEMPNEDQFDVFIADRPELRGLALYAGVIRGESMNQVYPPGTVVVLAPRQDGPSDLIAGRRYHIEYQRADGSCENTIKSVRVRADGSVWLVPESNDPAFQAPIPALPNQDEQIHFRGRVVAAIINEE
ncbi:transcriptional regulator, y4mF family [Hartmannibacter diazotrophicus]|uniref:Transcriptional regulator, y4mF family n=1 Tax=Hartmannibacter diazotrophicus TaxID=1482074 RepID=A0A2C9D5E7_9HYPH|nr:helix-turn-helix domain-containing protein [Hartmannibacter diazotrophicus]SON55506.1 transcriptional regulator, y4mF family [Hartmannibacter diazotrophicus]